ncbi:ATP-dependent DNA ligase, partial [Streptomyces sp. URMC 124]
YSRKLLDKTTLYPEVVAALSTLQHDRLLLDGEVVYFHPELGRPVFQKVLQRERSRSVRSGAPLFTYVLFDILVDGDKDMRK